jgi:hypothetical protein
LSPPSIATTVWLALATGLAGCSFGTVHNSGSGAQALPQFAARFPGNTAPSGDLTVPFFGSNAIGTFNAKTGTRLSLIHGNSTTLTSPLGATMDAAGNIYAVSSKSNPALLEFPVGSNGDAIPTISVPQTAYGITTDGTNVFIADQNTAQIMEYLASPLQSQPYATLSGSLTQMCSPRGIALDALGDIYITQQESRNCSLTGVLIFQSLNPGKQDFPPSRTLSGRLTRFKSPQGIAVDGSSNVYVADSATSLILKFTPLQAGDEKPTGTFGTGTTPYYGVVVDSSNNLYAAAASGGGDQYGEIDVFDATKPSTLPKKILKIGRKITQIGPYLINP